MPRRTTGRRTASADLQRGAMSGTARKVLKYAVYATIALLAGSGIYYIMIPGGYIIGIPVLVLTLFVTFEVRKAFKALKIS